MPIDYAGLMSQLDDAGRKLGNEYRQKAAQSRLPRFMLKQFPDGQTFFRVMPPENTKNPPGIVQRILHSVKYDPVKDAMSVKCLKVKNIQAVCPCCEIAEAYVNLMAEVEAGTMANPFAEEDQKFLDALIPSIGYYLYVAIYNPVVKGAQEVSQTTGKPYDTFTVTPTVREVAVQAAATGQFTPAVLMSFTEMVNRRLVDIGRVNPNFNDIYNGTLLEFTKSHTQYSLVDTGHLAPIPNPEKTLAKYPDLQKWAYNKDRVSEPSAAAMKQMLQNAWWFQEYGFCFDSDEAEASMITDAPVMNVAVGYTPPVQMPTAPAGYGAAPVIPVEQPFRVPAPGYTPWQPGR